MKLIASQVRLLAGWLSFASLATPLALHVPKEQNRAGHVSDAIRQLVEMALRCKFMLLAPKSGTTAAAVYR